MKVKQQLISALAVEEAAKALAAEETAKAKAVDRLKKAMVTNTVKALRRAVRTAKKITGFNPSELGAAVQALGVLEKAEMARLAEAWVNASDKVRLL